jgi:hypothetical protein
LATAATVAIAAMVEVIANEAGMTKIQAKRRVAS